MKVSILYSSKTGNTRKLAYSIANELSDFEITITDIKTMESLPQADAYLIGYWVDKAQPNEEAKHCIEQITGKPVGYLMYCGDKLLKFECKQGKIGMKRYLNDGILKSKYFRS